VSFERKGSVLLRFLSLFVELNRVAASQDTSASRTVDLDVDIGADAVDYK